LKWHTDESSINGDKLCLVWQHEAFQFSESKPSQSILFFNAQTVAESAGGILTKPVMKERMLKPSNSF